MPWSFEALQYVVHVSVSELYASSERVPIPSPYMWYLRRHGRMEEQVVHTLTLGEHKQGLDYQNSTVTPDTSTNGGDSSVNGPPSGQ